ncbi:MAG: hypothetical protein HYR63_24495 [Proteobacteria bacterium]|nr:hypothetical protein [Pseudomonadota bacterium]
MRQSAFAGFWQATGPAGGACPRVARRIAPSLLLLHATLSVVRRCAGGMFFSMLVAVCVSAGARADLQFANGVWWNAQTPGIGYAVEVNGNRMLMAVLAYRSSGTSAWYQASGLLFSSTVFNNTLIEYGGGQTLGGAARPPTTVTSVTSMSLAATAPSAASFQLSGGGPIAIQRYEFVSGGLTGGVAAAAPQTGWWWNANEPGRGYFIEVQGNRLLVLMMMYETDGSSRWYTATGDLLIGAFGLNPNMAATLEEYGGGQSLGGAYALATRTAIKGQIGISFSSQTAGILTLPNGAQVAITRFSNF